MGFDIATLVIFIIGIAFYAGTIIPRMDALLGGQHSLKIYLEKQLTKFDDRISHLEVEVEKIKEVIREIK